MGAIEPAEWERLLVASLSRYVRDRSFRSLRPELIEIEVVLEGARPDTAVVFSFRDSRYPDASLGYRWGPFWDWVIDENGEPLPDAETPESLATIILANFDEARELRFPEARDPVGTTWID